MSGNRLFRLDTLNRNAAWVVPACAVLLASNRADAPVECVAWTCAASACQAQISQRDYLLLLSEYGKTAGPENLCADFYLADAGYCRGDGYIDVGHLPAWEIYYSYSDFVGLADYVFSTF